MACRTRERPPAGWDADGDLHQVDSESVTYDAMGRVVEFSGSSTTEIIYGPAGGKLALGTLTNSCAGNACTQAVETYDYNNRLQPVRVQLGTSSNPSANYCLMYNDYPGAANPSSCAIPAQASSGDDGTVAGDALNDNTLSYTWDAEGRMTSVTGPLGNTDTMTYNALGERVAASFPDGSYTDTHIYPRDIFGHRLEIFECRPRTGWYGADQWWARVGGVRLLMGGSTSWLLHTDALDSTTMVTDQTGAVSGDVAYDPWGNVIAGGGNNGDAFAGLEYQINQVLPPSATRDYNPNFGRWMTPDPGGRKVVNLANPQTWNLYAYAHDNPTSLNDPSGMNACSPNDKSQSDCNVKIVIADRSKDKNGNYNDQFTNVKNEQNYNATAKVYVKYKKGSYVPKGTYLIKTTPSSRKYATIKAGTYEGTYILHNKEYPAILLSYMHHKGYGFGRVPALGGFDPFTNKPYISGAEIHRAGVGNYTGVPVSEGCSVVATCQYPSFESVTGLNAPAPQMDFMIMIGASANGGDQ